MKVGDMKNAVTPLIQMCIDRLTFLTHVMTYWIKLVGIT